MTNFVSMLVLLLGTTVFCKTHPNLRLVGGHEASPHQFPYQIGIYVNKSKVREFCDGTLVSSYYVLTAAHCVQNAKSLELILGAHNITGKEDTQLRITSTPEDIVIHPEYNWLQKKADLALVRLPVAVEENAFIKIIGIVDDNETFEGQIGTVTGWGLMRLDQKGVTPLLQYEYLKVISNTECKEAGGTYKSIINPTLMCTSGTFDNRYVGAGSGDSGGPLVVNKLQVGVLSFAGRNFTHGEPTTFVRLTEYKDWLKKYLNVNS